MEGVAQRGAVLRDWACGISRGGMMRASRSAVTPSLCSNARQLRQAGWSTPPAAGSTQPLGSIINLTPIKSLPAEVEMLPAKLPKIRTMVDPAKQRSPSPSPAASSPLPPTKGLPSDYQAFIHTSRYARWVEAKQRRETWPETIARYLDFMTGHLKECCNYDLAPELRGELETAILHLDVMPSMRAMMTAGPALSKCNIAGYNCSYLRIDHPHAFDEVLYILMNGTGVGFSVEPSCVQQLPTVAERFVQTSSTVVVEDSREGWAH